MQHTIHKYRAESKIDLPIGARILTAHIQNASIFLWATVDTSAQMETRYFLVIGTGWEMPPGNFRYIATVHENAFVWHVFEELKD